MALRRRTTAFVADTLLGGMARLNARHPWSHNDHFHGWVLANLPDQRHLALDVGCGRGQLAATLSSCFTTVHGTDVDESMRRAATSRCAGLPNVTIADGTWIDAPGSIDLVTMVAVLHHLDVPAALREVRRLLSPGGRFLAVGLAPPKSAVDHAWELASTATNPLIGYVKHPWPGPEGLRAAPIPTRDPTLPFDEMRDLVNTAMPGASMRRHLAFRHTIAWTKPARSTSAGC